jgi:ferritin-like metal-binding protein YciE
MARQEHPRAPPVSAYQQSNMSASRQQAALSCSQKRTPAMGLFTKDIKTMNDLFLHQLQDIYYAEKQLVKALPKMADKATDKQLKQGFLTHLDETTVHVQRLEQVFQMIGAEVKAVDCPAIDGIIKEANEVVGEVADKSVLDAALINAAQAAEHYEIVRYGSLIAWAKQLGRNDAASVLQKTLDEEKATDKKLTMLAESKVNLRAAS